MLSRSRGSERAFTLIELIVGMVLSLIVLGILFSVVLDSFQGADRSSARRKAQQSATKAADLLTADLRAAAANQRDPRFYGSPDSLRHLILQEDDGDGMSVHDIVVATDSQLRFYSDVDSDTRGPECVTWEVVGGALQRSVHALDGTRYGGCGAGALALTRISETRVIPAPSSDAAVTPAPPFAYRMLRVQDPSNPDPGTCQTVESGAGGIGPNQRLARDQVIAVHLDIQAFVTRRGTSGDQRQRTTVSIPSRQSVEYRYALGCAQ